MLANHGKTASIFDAASSSESGGHQLMRIHGETICSMPALAKGVAIGSS